jgi:hypothetical protein
MLPREDGTMELRQRWGSREVSAEQIRTLLDRIAGRRQPIENAGPPASYIPAFHACLTPSRHILSRHAILR